MAVTDFAVAYLYAFLSLMAFTLAGSLFFLVWIGRAGTRWMNDVASARRAIAGMEDQLKRLLKSGLHCGFMVWQDPESDRFIQFRKLIYGKSDYGIELSFPKAPWSQPYFPHVEAYCRENGAPYRIEQTGSEPVTEFLCVDFGHDVERAKEIGETIWTRIFGLPATAPCKMEICNVSPWKELIDRPGQKPMGLVDGLRSSRSAAPGNAERESRRDGCVQSVLTTAKLALLIIVPVVTLLSVKAPADWTIAFGGLTAGGSTASLVSLGLLLVVTIAVRRFPKSKHTWPVYGDPRINRAVGAHTRFINRVGPWVWRAAYGVPVAVVLVWLRP